MIAVHVASVQEVPDAVLERLQRRPHWKQLVSGDDVVRGVAVKGAPLPHGGVGPALVFILLVVEEEGSIKSQKLGSQKIDHFLPKNCVFGIDIRLLNISLF